MINQVVDNRPDDSLKHSNAYWPPNSAATHFFDLQTYQHQRVSFPKSSASDLNDNKCESSSAYDVLNAGQPQNSTATQQQPLSNNMLVQQQEISTPNLSKWVEFHPISVLFYNHNTICAY